MEKKQSWDKIKNVYICVQMFIYVKYEIGVLASKLYF